MAISVERLIFKGVAKFLMWREDNSHFFCAEVFIKIIFLNEIGYNKLKFGEKMLLSSTLLF